MKWATVGPVGTGADMEVKNNVVYVNVRPVWHVAMLKSEIGCPDEVYHQQSFGIICSNSMRLFACSSQAQISLLQYRHCNW